MTKMEARTMIVKHSGNISHIAAEVGITRQGVAWVVDKYKLDRLATDLRRKAKIGGPWSCAMTDKQASVERARLEDLCSRMSNEDVAARLKISMRTLARKKKFHGINKRSEINERGNTGREATQGSTGEDSRH